jgi:hypothetical protein
MVGVIVVVEVEVKAVAVGALANQQYDQIRVVVMAVVEVMAVRDMRVTGRGHVIGSEYRQSG